MNRPMTSGAIENPTATPQGTRDRRLFRNSVATAARRPVTPHPLRRSVRRMKCSSSDSRAIARCVGGVPAATRISATRSGASRAIGSRSSSRPSARRCGVRPAARRAVSAALEIAGLDFEAPVALLLQGIAVEFLDQPAPMDDADPVRQQIDLAEDVAGHEDRDALVPRQVAQQVADLDDARRDRARSPARRGSGVRDRAAGRGRGPAAAGCRATACPPAGPRRRRARAGRSSGRPAGDPRCRPGAGRRRGSRRPSARGRRWRSRPGDRRDATGRSLPARPAPRTVRRAQRSA